MRSALIVVVPDLGFSKDGGKLFSLSIITLVHRKPWVPNFGLEDSVPGAVIEECRKSCGWVRGVLTEDRHLSQIFQWKYWPL